MVILWRKCYVGKYKQSTNFRYESVYLFFFSLRVCLVHEATAIRSGGFRAIRHVLKAEDDIIHFNNLLIPVLIAR